MALSTAWSLQAYRRQHLLLEFASLKHVKLRGLYATITPGNPALWRCVLFIRKGPYTGALLRFRICFSDEYPFELPIVAFEHGTFHPLVRGGTSREDDDVFIGTPRKHASGIGETIGHFNLKSGFNNITTEGDERFRFSIIDILLYVRSCFDDFRIINNLDYQDITNSAAWQAWRNHNGDLKDKDDQQDNERHIWQREMDNLLERSSNVRPEDMFEEVKRNSDPPHNQLSSDQSIGAD